MKQLLAEELSTEETRALLERLHLEAPGSSEHVTLAAVIEATGADLEIAARHLADIRQEDFEARYDRRLDDQDFRLDRLESVTSITQIRADSENSVGKTQDDSPSLSTEKFDYTFPRWMYLAESRRSLEIVKQQEADRRNKNRSSVVGIFVLLVGAVFAFYVVAGTLNCMR